MIQSVAIVGAGIAGLAAARTLSQAGVAVTVFEKAKLPGGRIHTRHDPDGYRWDTGATTLTPRGKRIEAVIQNEFPQSEVIEITKPIWVHKSLRVSSGDPAKNRMVRYAFREGIQQLPLLLAMGLDIRLNTSIEKIQRDRRLYIVGDEAFDAVILTPPVPQVSQLLWGIEESRPLANARYRPCVSVMLAFDRPSPETPYYALLEPEQIHPMVWLSLESVKNPASAPSGHCTMTIQFNARTSVDFYSREDSEVLSAALAFTSQLYGPDFATPIRGHLKRWKYAQPEGMARFEAVNTPGSTLLIAGDGLLAGRIEDAYETGVRAAEMLIA